MSSVPFYTAGLLGVNKDLAPEELDPREWSDVRNVKFDDGRAIRPFANSAIFGTPTEAPYWVMPVQSGVAVFWVYSSLTKLYATDGASHAEVTRAVGGNYTVDKKRLWNGGTLSNIPVITNGADVPQMWLAPSLASDFANLSNWPAADRCLVLKPFKSFLVAMVILRGGNTYSHLVKWSHPAVPGSVPSSWDETDPTLQAGEVEIPDEAPGAIRDGGSLRDTFIIYKDNTTWGMQFIGGNSIFRFFQLFKNSGILSTHCFSEVNNGAAHFVATGNDFIIHDGQNTERPFHKRLTSWIYNQLPPTLADYCFCITKATANEVWFCFPEGGGEFPTLAAVYNWVDGTTTIRELGNAIAHADFGPIGTTSDPWDLDSATWDSDTTTWDEAQFSPHFLQMVGANPIGSQLIHLDDEINWASGYFERTGISVIGQDRVSGAYRADNEIMKLADRIWPKVKGAPVSIQIGGQEHIEAPVVYNPAQTFTPGVTKYLDFYPPINARFLAVKFTWSGVGSSEVSGYDLNIELLGDQ